jgi:hypothetical protein
VRLDDTDHINLWQAFGENADALARFKLLEQDLASVRFAFADFDQARAEVHRFGLDREHWVRDSDARGEAMDRMFHHAKVFVCGVRRFGRMLEEMYSRRADYPPQVAAAIESAFKKRRAFFHEYVDPRNAIEHMASKVNGSNHRFVNLWGDKLEVIDGCSVTVGPVPLSTVARTCEEISVQIGRAVDSKNLFGRQAHFLRILRVRSGID